MSARVLNPAMMTEMSRNLGVIVGSSGGVGVGVARVIPSRAALARVRRDLFGPVDHAAARALAERELRAQSMLDAERWGFDFRLEIPKSTGNSRFEWELLTAQDVVPEPYALRGMPYLRKQSPPIFKKTSKSTRTRRLSTEVESSLSPETGKDSRTVLTSVEETYAQLATERTPPQEPRVPPIGEKTLDVVPAIAGLNFRSKERSKKSAPLTEQTITPVLPHPRKQASITDFMKSRKRTLTSSTKSMLEPSEKVARNAGQIHS